MNVTRSMNSGCCSRNRSKAEKPRSTFFERSARSTRRIRKSRRRLQQLALEAARTRWRCGELARGAVVDRQRVGAHPDLALAEAHDAALEVDLEVHQVAAALQEVAPVGARVEADDVVREQAREDLLADARGQHAPGVRLRPRDVDEVVQEDVGAGAADEVRERVEVVVVDHHDRFARALDLLDDRAREVLVDDVVAELERLDLLAADVRRVGEVPEVVLDEPQHRVREHVVEAVVGLGVAHDQPHLVLAAGGRAHGERPPPCARETAASCSFIAEAIQIASRCEASPVSAVTRPPEPRCTSPSASKVTGPRLLTSTSGVRCAGPPAHASASSLKMRR